MDRPAADKPVLDYRGPASPERVPPVHAGATRGAAVSRSMALFALAAHVGAMWMRLAGGEGRSIAADAGPVALLGMLMLLPSFLWVVRSGEAERVVAAVVLVLNILATGLLFVAR